MNEIEKKIKELYGRNYLNCVEKDGVILLSIDCNGELMVDMSQFLKEFISTSDNFEIVSRSPKEMWEIERK